MGSELGKLGHPSKMGTSSNMLCPFFISHQPPRTWVTRAHSDCSLCLAPRLPISQLARPPQTETDFAHGSNALSGPEFRGERRKNTRTFELDTPARLSKVRAPLSLYYGWVCSRSASRSCSEREKQKSCAVMNHETLSGQ